MAKDVEDRLAKELNIERKIVCLDNETWQKEKEYTLMKEPEIKSTTEVFSSAESLFGDELVEIN